MFIAEAQSKARSPRLVDLRAVVMLEFAVPLLALKRPHFEGNYSNFCGRATLKMQIDGKLTVPLKLGQEQTVELSAGAHTLVAKMRWLRSETFSIILGEETRTVVVGGLPNLEAIGGFFIPPFVSFQIREVTSTPLPQAPS
jgi:hypothetical protein